MATRKPTTPMRRDHARPRHHPASLDPVLQQHLTDLVSPATYAVADQYRRLGMRSRVLNLPIMVALMLTLIWRQVPSVNNCLRRLKLAPARRPNLAPAVAGDPS